MDTIARRLPKLSFNDFLVTFLRWTCVIDKTWGLILFAGILIAGYRSIADENVGIAFMIILGIVIGLAVSWCVIYKKAQKCSLMRIYLIVFSISIITSCLMYSYSMYNNGSPYRYGFEDDDYFFDSKALEIYQDNLLDFNALRDKMPEIGSKSGNYVITTAWLYRIMDAFGNAPHPLFPRILNSIILSLIAVLVYCICIKCDIAMSIAQMTAYLSALFPYMLFNAVNTYRDIIVAFGIVAIIAGLINIFVVSAKCMGKSRRMDIFLGLILFVLGCFLTNILRDSYEIVVMIIILSCVAVLPKRFSHTIILIVLLSIVGLSLFFYFSDHIWTSGRKFALEYYTERNISDQGNITSVIFNMPYFLSIPFRIILRNFSPLPFPQVHLFDNMERIGTVLWLLMLPSIVRGLLHSFSLKIWKYNQAIRIVACFFCFFFIFNVMTTMQNRHIVTYIPAACILFAYYLSFCKHKVMTDFLKMVCCGCCLLIIYSGIHFF